MDTNNVLVPFILDTSSQIKTNIGKVVDFALEQTPLACAEYLNYNFVLHITNALIFACCVFVCARIIYLALRWFFRQKNKLDHPEILFTFIPIIIGVFCFCSLHEAFFAAIKIKLAPRVYLIEFARTLISN